MKIPTDLAGVVTSHYDWPRADMNHRAAVATAGEAIREKIQALGKREHSAESVFLGLDPKLVVERDGKLSATINGCEIAAAAGRIEDFPATVRTVVVLPCNEYFDDQCAYDTRSALGAYVNKVFPGKTDALFRSLKASAQRIWEQGPNVRSENMSALLVSAREEPS